MSARLERGIRKKLLSFTKKRNLPGIKSIIETECLIQYIIESTQRIEQVTTIRNAIQHKSCIDLTRNDFHPLKAAIYYKQRGNIDEAFWLVFLATHFGEDEKGTKYQWVQDVYGALGDKPYWTWKRTSANPDAFRAWLQANISNLKGRGRFGNHRKYGSLKDSHTGMAVATYIDWIGSKHQDMINSMKEQVGANPHELFDALYHSMKSVMQFGRTGRFDFCSMVGKLGLAAIEPRSPYLQGATGPLQGARLLFGESKMPAKILNGKLQELGEHLDLYFAHQIIEDAICNHHKSPSQFIPSLVE